jgi:hypothetical protein
MSLYTDIAWSRTDNLSQYDLNKRAKVIADAIENLRAFQPDWEAQVAALSEVGLERINNALLPAYNQITEVANLGALFSANSVSSVAIGLGTKTFLINEAQRLNFAPTSYVMAYSGTDFTKSIIGTLTSYDSETGILVMDGKTIVGAGTFSTWTIGPIATTGELEVLRNQVIDLAADVTAKKAVVDTKHGQVVAIGALYYGALSAAPSGAPLGAQYLDTSVTPNLTKVLTSTGWNQTVTVSVGGRRTQDYTAATNGMTGPFSVDGGFSTGDVFVNGVLLRSPSEATLAPGPSGTFTLVDPLSFGDLVSFRGFLANDAVDIYTKSETYSKAEVDAKTTNIPNANLATIAQARVIGRAAGSGDGKPVYLNDADLFAILGNLVAPKPKNGAGVGQFTYQLNGPSQAVTLPTGGTWAYYMIGYLTTGVLSGSVTAAVQAGGSTIYTTVTNESTMTLLWRIA